MWWKRLLYCMNNKKAVKTDTSTIEWFAAFFNHWMACCLDIFQYINLKKENNFKFSQRWSSMMLIFIGVDRMDDFQTIQVSISLAMKWITKYDWHCHTWRDIRTFVMRRVRDVNDEIEWQKKPNQEQFIGNVIWIVVWIATKWLKDIVHHDDSNDRFEQL